MPLTPSYGDGQVGAITRLYLTAEREIWKLIARTLFGEGWNGRMPWAVRMLLKLPMFRRGLTRIMVGLGAQAAVIVIGILLAAFRRGAREANADLRPQHPPIAAIGESEVQHLADRVIASLDKVHQQVPVSAEAIYRRTVDEVSRHPRGADETTLEQLLREVLARNARRGFDGQVDAKGRRYEFASYADMVVRSAVTHAEVDGYCAYVTASGHDLVIVSDVPGSCALCTPFEGAVISISGATTGTVEFTNSLGRPVTVTVKCSLAEARAAGLFHRNCRHTIRVWTADNPNPPGAVKLSEAERAQRRDASSKRRRNRIVQRIEFATRA
ncbi:phage minor capsid protein [Nocardia sp. NPDC056611]|uniref:phage minor capsid protein n=1 Tax=Nocardia sp. NPDC056611 TaxID=3345877 RepID=UPI00366B512D